MQNWTSGYVSEIDYTFGYYPDLNPLQLSLRLLYAGIKPPKFKNACELGFGQGVSLLSHAASSEISWYGNDFNPEQVAFARDVRDASGFELNLFDDDFEQFCKRSDLPQFDFIGLHGIWSWISETNQQIILDFIKNKLNVGGIVYISYNCSSGRSSMLPVRELMRTYAENMEATGKDIKKRIKGSIDFVEKVVSNSPLFARSNPLVIDVLKKIQAQPVEYLAHEYFNKDWRPTSFADISQKLSNAKLRYVASANTLQAIQDINFNNDQLSLISSIDDSTLREIVKDLMIDQSFRKDIWIKGAQKLSESERQKALLDLNVTLIAQPADVQFSVETPLGKADLSKDVYSPILQALSGVDSIKLSSLLDKVTGKISATQLIEAVMVLAGKSDILIANEVQCDQQVTHTLKLNNNIAEYSKFGNKVSYLTSPLTTTSVPVSRFDQLFMSALKEGKSTADELARYVWTIIDDQGQKIIKDNVALESDSDNLQELDRLANIFLEKKLPILVKLNIKL